MVEPLLGTTRESDIWPLSRDLLGQIRVTYWRCLSSAPEHQCCFGKSALDEVDRLLTVVDPPDLFGEDLHDAGLERRGVASDVGCDEGVRGPP